MSDIITFQVRPREILSSLGEGFSDPRDIAHHLLLQQGDLLEQEMGGEDAAGNFALAVFEQALDWRIGLTVQQLIAEAVCGSNGRKIPKPFLLEVDRRGKITVVLASGRRIDGN